MNKKKYIVILIVLILLYSISACSIKPITNAVSDRFWGFVTKEWDKEEQERIRRVENGEIVRGKDTILIWENMYVIGHYPDSNHLGIKTKEVSDVILEKVLKHKVKKKKLYIVSGEGYAVIDKNNICRVYITIPDDEFVEEYSKDSQGNLLYRSRRIDDEHIKYLSDFYEFSEEELKIFYRLDKS